ncbi:MAG: carbohydrate kinase [Alphaproteobacteria bacterium]
MFIVCGEALYDLIPSDLAGGDEAQTNALGFKAIIGGSPFNVAVGLARLGVKAALFTGISKDSLGTKLFNHLIDEGVGSQYLIHSDYKTTLALIDFHNGQPKYHFYGQNGAEKMIGINDLPKLDSAVKGLHFGSYSMVTAPSGDSYLEFAKRNRDRFISLDPNIRTSVEPDMQLWRDRISEFLPYVNLLKISREDIDLCYDGMPSKKLAEQFIEKGVQLVIITGGEDAVGCYSNNRLIFDYRPKPVNCVDTIGAGDSFQAALLAQLLEHTDPCNMLKNLNQGALYNLADRASKAAAITCARAGANLPTLSEWQEYLDAQAAIEAAKNKS